MGLLAPDGSLLEANRTALAAIAARPEDVIGKPFWETPWWKHSPALQQGLRELVTRAARGETVCSEADQWSHDGRQVWVEFTLKPVFDEHGRVALIIPEGRDITERKCAEQALRETVESLQAVFSASPVAIVVSSLEDGNIIEANQKAVEVFGYAREEAIGASAIDLWQDAQLRQTMIDDVKRNGAVSNLEVTMLRKDRELVTVLVSARRVVFRGIERLLTVAEDITERKRDQEEKARLQVQLYQAQKMEAIGRLAAGVAHDFNNLLTVIGGYTEMSLAGLSRENPAYQRLLEVIKASRRAADITHQLLAFSRRQPVEPTFVNLNALIRETEKMLRRLTGEETKFLINLTEAAVPGVRADVGHLVQVLMNLAVNARDAMPEGGLLTIETAVVNVGHEVSGASKLKPGPRVSLRVRDTGTGMDRETLSHIFEPFFTTKADGTGLGLSVVHGIVEQSGGSITVSSQPGIGSMFEILLPMVEPSTVSQERLGGEAIEAGTETVLLVDDDEAVRSFARQVLQGAGYRVVEAAGGMEALAAACSHEGPIDLLVSDLKMPEIGGREVARRLRQERPGLAVLYMSGYSSNETLDAVRADGSAGFIRKPFSPGFLLRRVRRELDGRSPTAS
jgi:PAS domain S-box-containing protein